MLDLFHAGIFFGMAIVAAPWFAHQLVVWSRD